MAYGKLPPLENTDNLRDYFATILSYGPAGAGKTHSIKTLKDWGLNPITLVTEVGPTAGVLTLKGLGLPFIRLSSHQETIAVLRELKKKQGKVEYEQQEFGAVVLDSITQWGEYPLERFVELKGWKDLQTPEEKKDPRQAYGFLAEKGRQLYKELFELPCHLYVVAREGLFGDGTLASPQFSAPELPGQKLPREVPGWPDATVRLRVIGGKFQMITVGEGGCPARVRLPEVLRKLPTRCRPDIGALALYMTEGSKEAYDALAPPKEEAKPPLEKSPKKAP
jgi:hypothetical protein